MKKEIGRIEGLKIALVGDLKYSRTIHSLIKALTLFDTKIYLVSPPLLDLPEEFLEEISGDIEKAELDEIIGEVDVVYVTRIQKERFLDEEEYKKVAGSYRITLETVKKMKDTAIILHPLPRIDEISVEVDSTRQAKYFKQAFYGVSVRMAILTEVML
ncbi:MAG: hypothetical protein QXK77_03955 [Archaeoglobaceae archaeon]